jgi:RNA polymerase sigma-70 factor (ECF subfamily)
MDPSSDQDAARLEAAGPDRAEALATLLEDHRTRLLRMVEVRMHPALRARIGASDVLQDAYLVIAARLGDYLRDPRMPFFLWIRQLTAQSLIDLQRRHLGAKKRDVRRQVPVEGRRPAATSVALADRLIASGTTPTQAVVTRELRGQLEDALDALSPGDREILLLRHFEELTNLEAARELGIEPPAASQRHVRALRRLRRVLEQLGLSAPDAGA